MLLTAVSNSNNLAIKTMANLNPLDAPNLALVLQVLLPMQSLASAMPPAAIGNLGGRGAPEAAAHLHYATGVAV
jgi:hypothetical protein